MKEKRLTQTQQVINTLREQGGYATLGNLYHLVDTSTWATKTPNESIRRIVNGVPHSHVSLLAPTCSSMAVSSLLSARASINWGNHVSDRMLKA